MPSTTTGVAGQTRTKSCIKCSVALNDDNWCQGNQRKNFYICGSCDDARKMWVGGKYISKKHPLWKAGRYKSWEDVANHQELNTVKQGYVYAISNQAWPAWVKIGMAVDADDRLRSYQTSDPHRSYELVAKAFVPDRKEAEQTLHWTASMISEDQRGEWFKMPKEWAEKLVTNMEAA